MKILGILCGLLLICGVLGVEEENASFDFFFDKKGVEEKDASFECLQNVVKQLTHSSCPMITQELEQDIAEYVRLYKKDCVKQITEEGFNTTCPALTPEFERNQEKYSRFYTACIKGHYLINGCNETEWVSACIRRVDNIIYSATEFFHIHHLKRNCREGMKDPDYECAISASTFVNESTCPELFSEASKNYSHKTLITKSNACLKSVYIDQGCREDQWNRVCNKQADKPHIGENNGEEFVDFFRNMCDGKDQSPSYKCFENATAEMDGKSCPEVRLAKRRNASSSEIGRQQNSCLKRYYLARDCKIEDWTEVCTLHSFSFQTLDESKLMRSYCNL